MPDETNTDPGEVIMDAELVRIECPAHKNSIIIIILKIVCHACHAPQTSLDRGGCEISNPARVRLIWRGYNHTYILCR